MRVNTSLGLSQHASSESFVTTEQPSTLEANSAYHGKFYDLEMDILAGYHMVMPLNSTFDNIDYSVHLFPNEIWIRKEDWEIGGKAIAFIVVVLLGILSNVLLLSVVLCNRSMRSPTNLLIANMAVADLVTLLILPWVFICFDCFQNYLLGEIGCKAQGFLECSLLFTGVLNLVFVSYDRLTAIMTPLEARLTVRGAHIMMASTWVTGVILGLPLIFFRLYRERQWKNFHETYCTEETIFMPIYWYVVIVFVVWLPLFVMVFCYSALFIKLDRYERKVLRREHPISVNYKTKVARTLFVVVVVFVVCRVPFTALIFLRAKLQQGTQTINQVPSLYIARFILGVACGAATVAMPLYNEEIADVKIRGALGVNMEIMFNVGILYMYVIGAFDSYLWLSISACTIPAIFAITFIWMPESPMFLVLKGEIDEAETSLRWLRGLDKEKSPDIERELNQMKEFVKASLSRETTQVTRNTKCRFLRECIANLYVKTPTAKAVRIILGLMIFQQLTGIEAVIYYTVDIFNDAGSSLSPPICAIIVGILQLLSTYIPSLIVDRAGRRVLLILSEVGMAVSLLILSFHFTMQNKLMELSWAGWVPLVAVNIYIIAFSVGLGPLPWLIMAELLSTEAKVWVSSMAVCFNWSLTFAVTKLFPVINHDLGPAITYGGFCFVCLLGVVFMVFFVPETRGKSREDIQLELMGM